MPEIIQSDQDATGIPDERRGRSEGGGAPDGEPGIILFDGVCNLCNGSVNFVIDRDPAGYFRFASLQSEKASELLKSYDLAADYLDSIVLIDGGRVLDRSSAILEIARHLSGAWPLMSVFRLVPRPIRDWVYDWIGRNRYRWFGKRDTCRIPTPELANRFLQ